MRAQNVMNVDLPSAKMITRGEERMMEVLERLSKTIQHIEEHLLDDIDVKDLAGICYCSTFHYQRLFQILTGVTVGSYIRNRRLTLAAQELANSSVKVIDLSMKYGYESPESFSRAFRSLHGISPSKAKKEGRKLKAFPKISFQIQIRGVVDMEYKIIKKEAFKIIGNEKRVTTENGENLIEIPNFWNESIENGEVKRLESIASSLGILGVCMDFDEDLKTFSYVIAVEEVSNDISEGRLIKEIPAATWAVFEAIGPVPHAIQDTWKRIFSEWFPATGYEHANGPEIEVYAVDCDIDSKDHLCEIWIPIIDKVN